MFFILSNVLLAKNINCWHSVIQLVEWLLMNYICSTTNVAYQPGMCYLLKILALDPNSSRECVLKITGTSIFGANFSNVSNKKEEGENAKLTWDTNICRRMFFHLSCNSYSHLTIPIKVYFELKCNKD